jgi:hypothetical protein
MQELHDLMSALREEAEDQTLVVLAVYPKASDTGLRDEQGALVERLAEDLLAAGAGRVYRVMWSQIGLVFRGQDAGQIQDRVVATVSRRADERLEVRAVLVQVRGTADERVALFDAMLGELSSRRNFGSAEIAGATRMVDSRIWPQGS